MQIMWYAYTVEFYSAIKKKKNLLFEGKCMQLEITPLSKGSQIQGDKYHMFPLICAY